MQLISDKHEGRRLRHVPPIAGGIKRSARGEFLLVLKQWFPVFAALKKLFNASRPFKEKRKVQFHQDKGLGDGP